MLYLQRLVVRLDGITELFQRSECQSPVIIERGILRGEFYCMVVCSNRSIKTALLEQGFPFPEKCLITGRSDVNCGIERGNSSIKVP